MEKVKVCLLGAGFIAEIHLESCCRFVPEAEVVGVYTRNPAKARAFAERHPIPRGYSDLDQAIAESGAEVVDVCLPNFLHAEATLKAAEAGTHVILPTRLFPGGFA